MPKPIRRQDQLRQEAMKRINPKYILRNHLAQQAITQAEYNKEYSEVTSLMHVLQAPFDEHPELEKYAALPPNWAKSISISCSS